MRAAVMREAGAPLSVETVEPVALGPRDVLVRVGASGLCHSDLTFMGNAAAPVPIVIGHEGAGVVEEIGRDVDRVKPGDRVIASWVAPCGHCYWCVRDETHLCADWTGPAGRSGVWKLSDGATAATMVGIGTMAEYMCASERALVRVETDLPDEQLALIGCGVTTGVCAVLRAARVPEGASVVVVGCGGVGTSAIQGARIAGALTIIAVDPVALKREHALAVGATHALDAGEGVVEAIRDLTGGRGADYAFEVSGRADAAKIAYDAVRRGGMFVEVGGGVPEGVLADGHLWAKTAKSTLYGEANVARDFPMLVRMAETGLLDLTSMVSSRIALDDVNEGFAAMERGEVIRAVVVN